MHSRRNLYFLRIAIGFLRKIEKKHAESFFDKNIDISSGECYNQNKPVKKWK